jgi:hypothetical protein
VHVLEEEAADADVDAEEEGRLVRVDVGDDVAQPPLAVPRHGLGEGAGGDGEVQLAAPCPKEVAEEEEVEPQEGFLEESSVFERIGVGDVDVLHSIAYDYRVVVLELRSPIGTHEEFYGIGGQVIQRIC